MKFEKDYFKHSRISNYKNYVKKKYAGLAGDLIENFKFYPNDRIIDFGCATGNLIYEFKKRGLKNVLGTDISYWAISHGRKKFGLKKELQFFNINLLAEKKDYVLFLDVLEHITIDELTWVIKLAKRNLEKAVIVRVPVSLKEGEHYFLAVSRNDKTHIQCHTAKWWECLFEKNGYILSERLGLENIYCSKGVFAAAFRPEKSRSNYKTKKSTKRKTKK